MLAGAPTAGPVLKLLNRESAILDFNRRVLAQARRADVPLLERLRYITIVSSNLDEFFEVRAAPHLTAVAGESAHFVGGVSAADFAHWWEYNATQSQRLPFYICLRRPVLR